ncbi:MAG: DNA polymerase III subunit gamma/tau, partial [Elioraea sp.]|nr:DNA polymerase III subunit gamma/tau [Elioraea sp.]
MSDLFGTPADPPPTASTTPSLFGDPPPPAGGAASAPAGTLPPYRVLARKYRPQTFAALIGQEALVRTLTNAFASGRIAHAYMLTGVRGVGKTTTARLIARALNCTGADGTRAAPTISPCGVCDSCRAIAEDRHPDVLEIDAASNTGVQNVRETVIEGARYAPLTARYKVYIVDEVHMLSTAAFNALLKTLEEPPPRVVFIFATTEIRKVPVTVLSRCLRFDLRRIPAATLARHYAEIADREGIVAEPEALALIARAADGSVRDGLSLLDQAIALAGDAPL